MNVACSMADNIHDRSFKQRRSFAQRKCDVENILEKYTDKIPCVIERYANEKRLPRLDSIPEESARQCFANGKSCFRSKFLVADYLTFGELLRTIRQRLELHPEQAFFLLVNQRVMPSNTMTMAEIYANEKDQDGYLYMVYATQDVFGAITDLDDSTRFVLRIPFQNSHSEEQSVETCKE
ncbi:microtubule-associated proteins 1A/1B light chain 3A isoform 1 [Tropilaelaps mercedesae]|uniref:Microtubule-associated proteins 1A/1B light chain 3A isoform 1 n=1 Tax=Tropilaelaps mercedesae TaxID=418985 RepID=A0A1V9XQ92_9ACAR|nr:microtubule-associated proteins 1A/1B light chain 3A isoform 1 [Tropilaelaps mercedesae]